MRRPRRPSLGLGLFLVGFNALYLFPLVFARALRDDLPTGSYRYFMLACLLVLAGAALEVRHVGFGSHHHSLWVACLAASLCVLAGRSVVDGEPLLAVVEKLMPFLWLMTVPAIGQNHRNWPWLWLTLILHVPVAAAFCFQAFVVNQATSRAAAIGMVGQTFLAHSTYMGSPLLLMLPILRGPLLVGAATGTYALDLLRSLFFASRLPWLFAPVHALLLLYVFRRSRSGSAARLRPLLLLFLALALTGVVTAAISGPTLTESLSPKLADAHEALIKRLEEKGTVGNTITENERRKELEAVVATMDGSDWVFGKGLAARWSESGFAGGEERYMVHNTWLNALYWGGVLLLVPLALPALWALRSFGTSRNAAGLSASAYLLVVYLGFPAYMRTHTTMEWLVFCLLLGACIAHADVAGARTSRPKLSVPVRGAQHGRREG